MNQMKFENLKEFFVLIRLIIQFNKLVAKLIFLFFFFSFIFA